MRAGYHPSHINTPEKDAEKNDLKKQGFYYSPAWRRVRKQALQRDHFLCQECLKKKRITKATEVHHLRPVAQFPALALDLDNLQSLCWDCHEATKPRSRSAGKSIKGVRIIRITDGSDNGF